MMTVPSRKGSAIVTLPSDTEILITRAFDAPAEKVYRAWTTPGLIERWWHANRGEVVSAEVDLRVGGRWRWVMLAHGEREVAFHGEYREIVAARRLVYTEVYEGFPDGEALDHVELTEVGGITTVTMRVTHSCKEHRDLHLRSGMEDGLQDALDLLDALAASLT